MFSGFLSNWANPEVIMAIVGFRVLCNIAIFGYAVDAVGVRSGYTFIVGALVAFSTISTMLLLSTGWIGHSGSYLEQASQILILGVSAYVAGRISPRPVSNGLLLAWLGAIVLLLVMVPLYGEAFVAP